ncbi:Rab3 GTPase-activating protein catalytic subunit [Lamellibrachia satsuma]|nr:Rab3 GTPase-activating protein catalytic subunit [Lamellibrachia satsuma]
MTEDESEVFEITDFTTASEWERFIARLEEIFHEWKTDNLQPIKEPSAAGTWVENVEQLQFADFQFVITKHSLVQTSTTAPPSELREQQDGSAKEESSTKEDNEIKEHNDQVECCSMAWQDMMSVENDFPSRTHCLSRWYGLHNFIVLSPGPQMDEITTESRLNLLLSSITIALNNTGCQMPVFVQAHQKWRKLFYGRSEFPGFSTNYEMVHLKTVPQQYSHLAGLLDVFKEKLSSPVSPVPAVSVTVRFTYLLQDWVHYGWPQAPPDFDANSDIGFTDFGDLPFGACEDPVSELHLSATWPSLSEEMIVEDDVYSDLDPLQAPHWCVRVRMTDSPVCLLGDFLLDFVQLCRKTESTNQLLSKSLLNPSSDTDVDVSHALSRLTEPTPYPLPSLGTVVTSATSKLAMKPEEAPIANDLLNKILLFLFPDAKSNKVEADKLDTGLGDTSDDMSSSKSDSSQALNEQSKEMFKQFKSAPVDSLPYRLAICMCIINHSYGGVRAVAHLWQEFVLEMRFRWENSILIPDLASGSPNMGCSLLFQKLQMLNCCIERKQTHEALQSESSTPSTDAFERKQTHEALQSESSTPSTDAFGSIPIEVDDDNKKEQKGCSTSSDEDEDEFFECVESSDEASVPVKDRKIGGGGDAKVRRRRSKRAGDVQKRHSSTKQKSDDDQSLPEESDTPSFTDTLTHQPEGRQRPYNDLYLLNIPGEHLYVPVTQEPAPMTEDMLDEQAEVLAKLGTSSEGAHLRARMQSACLLSDMEAFKAANPGCTLGDFVRWYSPRDWVEEETVDDTDKVTVKGQLSQRMQIPGNMWVEVWQSAKPVPCRRQRRLFDDTKEAEKVLHWLAAMKPADVAIRLMPMSVHAAIATIIAQGENHLPTLQTLLGQITQKATQAMRAPHMDCHRFEDLMTKLAQAEMIITRAQSLHTKFNEERHDVDISDEDLSSFVSTLLDQPEVDIMGAARGPLGIIIQRLFATAQKSAGLFNLSEDERDSEEYTSRSSGSCDFPAPVGKEYILRTTVPRPAPWSRPSPQRMYCVLLKDDFRLAGAYSTDTTFQ